MVDKLDTKMGIRYNSGMKRINIKLDPETHRLLKLRAITESTTIQASVVHLIKAWVYPVKNGK